MGFAPRAGGSFWFLITLLHVSVGVVWPTTAGGSGRAAQISHIYINDDRDIRFRVRVAASSRTIYVRLADPARCNVAGQLCDRGVSRQLGLNREISPPHCPTILARCTRIALLMMIAS